MIPPMGQIWELPVLSPSDSHGGSSSSVGELFEDDGVLVLLIVVT